MIHYFITWFKYIDHYENCIKHVQVGGMKPEYQKQNVQRESSFFSRGGHPRYMLSNHHEVRKDLTIVDVRGRVSILSWCNRCRRLVLLKLVNLSLKVVNDVVPVRERYSTVLYLLFELFQLLLHTLDLQVLRGLVLLKLTGLHFGGLLSRLQKDTVPK
jgi:hypothetical protein